MLQLAGAGRRATGQFLARCPFQGPTFWETSADPVQTGSGHWPKGRFWQNSLPRASTGHPLRIGAVFAGFLLDAMEAMAFAIFYDNR